LSTVSKKLDSSSRPPARRAGGPPAVDLTIAVWPTADLCMSVLAAVDKPAHRSLELPVAGPAAAQIRRSEVPMPER